MIERLADILSGRYRVERELGRGGGGRVFLAHDVRHGRQVAIKVLDPGLSRAIGAERFLREIRITAGLTHPHILPLLDSGSTEDLTWFALPYAEGGTLRERLRSRGRLEVDEAVRITSEVADALASAHRHGIVHRDVKPENILFEEDHALLGDFGIARALAGFGTHTLTESAAVLGTPSYMSPEQIDARAPITGASDQYALACVLFESLAGRPPFVGDGATSVLTQHVAADPPVLSTLRSDVPRTVEQAIRRGLAKDPERRFSTIDAFRDAISGESQDTVEVPRARRRVPRLAWIAVPLLAGAVAVAVLRPWTHPASRVRSLAVLPLDNVSGNAAEEYYADGMTEELILELSKISALRVISRTSVMSLKDRELPLSEVGKKLGVDAVIEGTVARRDGRLRVSLQLFRVKPEGQLWAQRYDRPADSALELQAEIARAVVGPVQVQMTPAEARRLGPAKPIDPAAHEAFLRGRFAVGEMDSAHMADALRQFNRAVELSPDYALAWTGLARAYYLMSNVYLPPDFAMERARSTAQRALDIDPDCAAAHGAIGCVLSQYDWKFKEAEREFREGLRLDPSDSDCHWDLAYTLLETGRIGEARKEFEIARQLDPLSSYKTNFCAYASYCARDFADSRARYLAISRADPDDKMPRYSLALIDLAEGHTEDAIARLEPMTRNPDFTYPLAILGYAYARAGREADATRMLTRLEHYESNLHVRPTDYAIVYVGLGDFDHAMEWFRKASASRDENLISLFSDPLLDPIRKDPRFRSLVRGIGAAGT